MQFCLRMWQTNFNIPPLVHFDTNIRSDLKFHDRNSNKFIVNSFKYLDENNHISEIISQVQRQTQL